MNNFTSKELLQYFPAATTRQYGPGQIVVYEGDQPAHVFFVTAGALKNYDIDENGSEKILHIVGQTSLFPILFVFGDNEDVITFYSTLDDTELLLLPKDDFVQKVTTDVKFANLIFRGFVKEVDFIMDRIRAVEKAEAKGKVLKTLQYLLERHAQPGASGWALVKFPISQQILADMVGLTRETVSSIMKELDDNGVIRSRKLLQLKIHGNKLAKSLSNGSSLSGSRKT